MHRYSTEQIVSKLRQAEVELSRCLTESPWSVRNWAQVSEHTYYRCHGKSTVACAVTSAKRTQGCSSREPRGSRSGRGVTKPSTTLILKEDDLGTSEPAPTPCSAVRSWSHQLAGVGAAVPGRVTRPLTPCAVSRRVQASRCGCRMMSCG